VVHVAGARLPIPQFLRIQFEILLQTAMSGLFSLLVFGVSAQATTNRSAQATTNPKHILFLMIDDLGWNDVGYRKTSDLKSPHIDALAKSGVRLNRYYTSSLCSPSRTSFLSGRYAYSVGMHGPVIQNGYPVDLPKNVSTVADRLRNGGFKTAMIGKWDAGMTTWDYTPTCRGFDYFFGFYGAVENHYTRVAHFSGMKGLDLRENFDAQDARDDVYSTHLYTEKAQAWISRVVLTERAQKTFMYLAYQAMHGPLQSPGEYSRRCRRFGVTNTSKRDIYCGMMLALDEGVNNVTDTYKSLGIWDDTLLVFASDNGGNLRLIGNNWPLRGGKSSNYEGGVRATAFFYWSGLSNQLKGTESEQLIHVSDWLPTFVGGVAGMKVHEDQYKFPIDGVDQWDALTVPGAVSTRSDVLHQIGIRPGNKQGPDIRQESYFDGQYKIIRYVPSLMSKLCGWYPLPGRGDPIEPPAAENLVNGSYSFRRGGTWLFDVIADPLEITDLSGKHPEVVDRLTKVLEGWKLRNIDQLSCNEDPKSDPIPYFDGVWTPWRGSRTPSCNAGGHPAYDNKHC